MKTRILQFSTENGNQEYVVFTEDLKTEANVWLRPDLRPVFHLVSDTTIDVEMPRGFPLQYELDRH